MIEKYIKRYYEKKSEIESLILPKHPDSYKDLVKIVIQSISTDESGEMDANCIHEIDDGNCQGTLLYVIPENTYQPFEYWHVRVSYGSCSGCDTLAGIREYSDDKPTQEQVDQYMILVLYIIQNLKKMSDDS